MDELSLLEEQSYSGSQDFIIIGSVGRPHQDIVRHFRNHQPDIDSGHRGRLEGVQDRLGRDEIRGLEIYVRSGMVDGPFVAVLEDRVGEVGFVRD